MEPPKTSLLSRLVASSVVLTLLILLITAGFFYGGGLWVRHTVERTLYGYSQGLAERLLISDDVDLWRAVARQHEVAFVLEKGATRIGFDRRGNRVDPDHLFTGKYSELLIEMNKPGGRVVFAWDLIATTRGHLWIVLGLLGLLAGVVGLTHLFQSSQLKPLKWLRTGVEAVARGDFKSRVPVVRQDEIGQVAEAFNQMTDRVERMLADRERLLGDVSHELRSPIARVKVALELLPKSDKQAAIKRDMAEMEGLISALLDRERVRTNPDGLAPQRFDLAEVTREVLTVYAGREPGLVFDETGNTFHLDGDPALVKVCIQNLVDNALKFSLPDSKPVAISIKRDDLFLEVNVIDDGPGIPEKELTRIFEPFVKLNPARGHRSGYGLGLDLSQRIAEAHNGAIHITRVGQRGTQASLRLPCSGESLG